MCRRLRAASSVGRFLLEEEIEQGGRRGSVLHIRGRRRGVQRREYLRGEGAVQRVRQLGNLVQVEAGHVEKQAQAHEIVAQPDRGFVPAGRYERLRRDRRGGILVVRGASKESESVEGGRRATEGKREIPTWFDESGPASSPEQQQFRVQIRQLRDIQREQLQPELENVPGLVQFRGDRGVLGNEGKVSQALLQEGDVHGGREDLRPGRGEDASEQQAA